jgi:hypothetical protein|tara:strand:- start:1825 stop:2340 length:516 start_codon:yes stop_codon:yes gene_type:complete
MDSLMQAMHLIDKHSDKIPEGDYLEICNNLKKAYTTRTDPLLFFDYENIRICPDDGDLNIAYFYIDHYFERAIDTDGDFIQSQINYLENEISLHSPLQRISKSLRERVLRQYCTIGGVDPEDRYQHFNKQFITKCCRVYIELENEFRSRYREAIMKRIYILEETIENLTQL